MRGLFGGIRRLVRGAERTPDQVARDVEDEVGFHLAMKAEQLAALGHTRDDAGRMAHASFGDVARATAGLRADEIAHDRVRRWAAWIGAWRSDVAFTVRQMRRAPGFALLVVGTLALGIGATTAVFSAVHAIVLAPLPYHEPDRLVRVMRETPNGSRESASGGDFLEFQRAAKSLSGLTSYYTSTANLVGFGDPQRVVIGRVSWNFFGVLGVRPLVGRTFAETEDVHGAPETLMVSEGVWRRVFGADPQIVGRTVRMDHQVVRVIGVVPAGRGFPTSVDYWLTARHEPEMMGDDNRGASWLRIVGRLAPGASVAQADAEFRTLSASIAERFPEARAGNRATIVPMTDALIGNVRQPLWVMLGAVGLVLLVACTNVAALLLGRLVSREGELTVRAALGAGRRRLVRQLLTESAVLGLVGSALGIAVAYVLVQLLVSLAPQMPRLASVRIDALVLTFSVMLGLVTGIIFGVVPAWHLGRRDLHAALRGAGRGGSGTRHAGHLRSGLVVGQFAMAIVLLVGAGLLLRTFVSMRAVDLGFDPSRASVFTVTLPQDGSFDGAYGGVDGQRRFLRSVLPELQAIPGVTAIGASFALPLTPNRLSLGFEVAGRPKPPAGQEPEAQVRVATPGFFPALGLRLARGRLLTEDDRAGAPMVLVVTEAFARQHFAGQEVIGQRVTFGWERDSMALSGEIVGVIRDITQTSLTDPPSPVAWVSADQWPIDEYTFVMRTSLPLGVIAAAAREVVQRVDAELPLHDMQRADELVRDALSTTRFYLVLLMLFAVLALVLAALGIYGVISFGVQQRTREFGIRMALGATRIHVRSLVVRDGMRLTGLGVVIGTAGAMAVSGVLRSELYGVQPNDPVTLAAVLLVLVAAALMACLVPARRAARIDPQRAIRAE